MHARYRARIVRSIRNAIAFSAIAVSGCGAIVDKYSGRGEACDILAIGTPAQARVLRLIDTGTTINDDPVIAFVLEVMPTDSAPYEAHAKALVSRLDVPAVQPGRMFPVKFDPQQPTRVAIDQSTCR